MIGLAGPAAAVGVVAVADRVAVAQWWRYAGRTAQSRQTNLLAPAGGAAGEAMTGAGASGAKQSERRA